MSIGNRDLLHRATEAAGHIFAQFWTRKGGWPARTAAGSLLEGGWYPVAGWLVGAVIALASAFCGFLFHPWAGVLIFAAVSWTLLTFSLPGEGDGIIAARLAAWFPEVPGLPPARFLLYAFLLAGKLLLLLLIGLHGVGQFPLLLAWTVLLGAVIFTAGGRSPDFGRGIVIPLLILSLLSLAAAPRSVPVFTIAGIAGLRYLERLGSGHRHTPSELHFLFSICLWLFLVLGVLFPC